MLLDPDVKAAVASFNLPPWAGLSFATCGAITLFVRMRNNSQDPVR